MRTDMSKVVVERPRAGPGCSYGNFRKTLNRGDYESLPHKQGIRRPYIFGHGDCYMKQFSDLLGPLRGYLRSCVGRPWDDVWSEICANLRPDSTTQQHIRDHILSEVEIHTWVGEDGKIYLRPNISYSRLVVEAYGLYVDPRDGILRNNPDRTYDRNAYRKAEADAEAKRRRVFGKELEAYKIDGIWYWAVFRTVPQPARKKKWSDDKTSFTLISDIIEYTDLPEFLPESQRPSWPRYYGKPPKTYRPGERYRASKKQLSSRDLRKHALSNDR